MGVAVCLRFDAQTTVLVERLWRKLGSDTLRLGYPPHLSLIVASDEADVGRLLAALPRLASQVPVWIELGEPRAFPNSEVAYIECLGDLGPLHRLVADLVPRGAIHEHYLPETWTPHLTLLSQGDTAQALAVAAQEWQPCGALPVALDLVTFPPVAVHASASID